MTDAVPILIGITGKRRFAPDPTSPTEPAETVRTRLRQVFAELDARYPGTAKLLLTGGAQGSDLIAAQEALGPDRASWSVAVLLPFDRALFEKDFDDASLPQFRALCAQAETEPARVMLRTLPPLRTSAGAQATPAQLDRSDQSHDLLRHQHYEQVGQFIAETAMVLIAVMDENEQPNRQEANGGTARIVACRRAGRPDALGAEVASRSVVVRSHWSPLVAPPGGAVWLIDPQARRLNKRLPVRILPPLSDRDVVEIYKGHPARDMPKTHDAPEGLALWRWLHRRRQGIARHAPFLAPRAERQARRNSHLPAQTTHSVITQFRRSTGEKPQPSPAFALEPQIKAMRATINSEQYRAKALSEGAFIWIARLFVAAVLSLELFSTFIHAEATRLVPLGLYGVLLLAITAVVMVAEQLRWQPHAEDYRAVTEMLRVQKAWWNAGITARVDREHLQGAGADLLPIRDMARALLGLVTLRLDFAPCRPGGETWPLVRAPGPARSPEFLPKAPTPADWVGEQLQYFAKRQKLREHKASRWNCITWVLFTLSGALAGVLWLKLAIPAVTEWFASALNALRFMGQTDASALIWLALAGLALRTRFQLHHVTTRWASRSLTTLACILAAICLGIGIQGLAPRLVWLLHAIGEHSEATGEEAVFEASKDLMEITFIMLTALAGAVRFATERLGLEAEALAYRDALERFERAERFLAAAIDPATGLPHDPAVCRAVVQELGTMALRENESWLEAHRERPLSPVVG